MPPHIAQLVVGHGDINTPMGYKKNTGKQGNSSDS
jgi:hypothetical protein